MRRYDAPADQRSGLEERVVTRVGSLKPRPIDVRFVSATNRDLEKEVEAGRFRQDLFFRLNGLSVTIPPLRERRAEIAPLARLFVARACTQMSRAELPISPEAMAELQAYAWPGNIRELRNMMERAVVLCTGDSIRLADLPLDRLRGGGRAAPAAVPAACAPPKFERCTDRLSTLPKSASTSARFLRSTLPSCCSGIGNDPFGANFSLDFPATSNSTAAALSENCSCGAAVCSDLRSRPSRSISSRLAEWFGVAGA